jgi:hypothetical protein
MSEVTQEKSYDELYREAAEALEAGEQPKPVEKPVEPAPTTPAAEETKPEAPAEPITPVVDPVEELRKKLEATEKALKDTQRWAHETNAKLKKQDEDRRRAEYEAAKPQLLRDNPEFEQAIKYATATPQAEQEPQKPVQTWEEVVFAAHPDLSELQTKDPDLWKAAVEHFETLPDKGNDPFNAIRALNDVKLDFAQKRASEAAIQKAEAARAQQQAAKSAMSVPGGSGTVQTAPVDPQQELARKMWNMSDEDFRKETARVMGNR